MATPRASTQVAPLGFNPSGAAPTKPTTNPLKKTIDLVGADAEPYETYKLWLKYSYPDSEKGYPDVGYGLVLSAVKPEGVLGIAGFHDGDILLTCGGKRFIEADDFISWLGAMEAGRSYTLSVIERPERAAGRAVFKPKVQGEIILNKDGKLSVTKVVNPQTK